MLRYGLLTINGKTGGVKDDAETKEVVVAIAASNAESHFMMLVVSHEVTC